MGLNQRARAVGEKWESLAQAMAFIQKADQDGYVERKNEMTTEKYKST